MAKKTRAQKKRADERKNLQGPAPALSVAPTPIPTSNEIKIEGLSLDETKVASREGKLASPSHNFLKKDLLKVGALAVGAVVFEYAVNWTVKHGLLSHWGIS